MFVLSSVEMTLRKKHFREFEMLIAIKQLPAFQHAMYEISLGNEKQMK